MGRARVRLPRLPHEDALNGLLHGGRPCRHTAATKSGGASTRWFKERRAWTGRQQLTPRSRGRHRSGFKRERFTKALEAICTRLDRQHVGVFEHAPAITSINRYFAHGMVRARVLELYAFGSWSRGPLECGDLDLFAVVKKEWAETPWRPLTFEPAPKTASLPAFRYIKRHLFGQQPHVHIVEKQQLVDWEQPEAVAQGVLIWKPRRNWRAAIADIKPDPAARRASRVSDAFPLQVEQTAMRLLHVENAVRAQLEGLLDWKFFPHGEERNEVPPFSDSECLLQGKFAERDAFLSGRRWSQPGRFDAATAARPSPTGSGRATWGRGCSWTPTSKPSSSRRSGRRLGLTARWWSFAAAGFPKRQL